MSRRVEIQKLIEVAIQAAPASNFQKAAENIIKALEVRWGINLERADNVFSDTLPETFAEKVLHGRMTKEIDGVTVPKNQL